MLRGRGNRLSVQVRFISSPLLKVAHHVQFVRLLTRDNSIAIGNGFEPETSAIEAVPFFDPVSGRNMTILDTPGFGDSRESITESEILERINKFLLNEYVDLELL